MTSCFSFYPNKSFTTGDGGMVTTSDPEFAHRLRDPSSQGTRQDAWDRRASATGRYQVIATGFKCAMNDIEAALGLVQMPRLQHNWQRRKQLAELNDSCLQHLPIGRPVPPRQGDVHAHRLYAVAIDPTRAGLGRDEVRSGLAECGVEARIHYPSIPSHPFFQTEYGWRPEAFPNALRFDETTLSLPLTSSLEDDDIRYVAGCLEEPITGRRYCA